MRGYSRVFALSILMGVLSAARAEAAVHLLGDDNSAALIDTGSPGAMGMFQWQVEGVNQLSQQSFWYRHGGAGQESNLSSGLTLVAEHVSDTNWNGLDDALYVKYSDGVIDVEVTYLLNGGALGSNASDVAEIITLTNTQPVDLDFHFFQYSDFDLNGTMGDDYAMMMNHNTVRQWDSQTVFSETVVTPAADRWEIAPFGTTLTSLNDASITTLGKTPGIGTVMGPMDLTWAFQWDFTIPAGHSVQISKDKRLAPVPEPTTLSLLALGGLAVLRRRR